MYRSTMSFAALALALACAGQRPRTAPQDTAQRASAADVEGRAGAQTMRGRPAASTTAANADVLALITDYDRAWRAKDRTRLSEILDPSYIYFTSKGAVWPRDRLLRLVLSPDYELSAAMRGELAVHGDGATATVSSRWTGAGTFKEHAFSDDQRCSLTVTRRADRLVVLAEHCTQIVP